ncbi:MAG: prepilin peptidase [Azospirillum sp.]|nr:prepilin peptidase [Azospirillum sp.]
MIDLAPAIFAVFVGMACGFACATARQAGESDDFRSFRRALKLSDARGRQALPFLGGFVFGVGLHLLYLNPRFPAPTIPIFLCLLFFLAAADWRTCLVPTWAAAATFVYGVLFVAENPMSAALLGIFLFLLFYVYFFTCEKLGLNPGFGFGDVLPVCAVFAAFGPSFAVVAAGLAALGPLLLLVFRRPAPYVPFLYVSVTISLATPLYGAKTPFFI